jgi:hypothetical protein
MAYSGDSCGQPKRASYQGGGGIMLAMPRLLTCAALAALVSLGLTPAPAAQGRPDFSGRWTTDPPPATEGGSETGRGARGAGPGRGARGGGRGPRAGDMGSGWGPTITIAQDPASLTIEWAFFTRGDMQPPLRFTYALDGSETTNTVMMGRGMQTQKSKTAWNGERLVITTVHTADDPSTGRPVPVEVTQTLSLDAGSLVVETARAGVLGGPATSTRTVYRRITGT